MKLGFLWLLPFISVSLCDASRASADTFLGCADYCKMKSGMNKLAPGQSADFGTMRAYDNCVVLSQQEGYCGRKPKADPSPSPSPSASKSPTPNKSPSPTPSPSVAEKSLPSASVCIDQYNSDLMSCSGDYSSANSICSTDSNPALRNAINAASTATLAVGQQTAASLQAACANMGAVGQVSSAALVAYRTGCQQAKNSCVTSCSTAKHNFDDCIADAQSNYAAQFVGYTDMVQAQADFRQSVESDPNYKTVASQLNQCNSMQTNIDQAAQALQNFTATTVNAQACANLTAAALSTATGAAGTVANSQLTFCQQNPADPTCQGGGTPQRPEGLAGASGGGSSSGGATKFGASSLNLDSGQVLPPGRSGGVATGATEDPGGKKGNGAALGGDSLIAPGKAGAASLNEGRYAYHEGGFYAGSSTSGAGGPSGSASLPSQSMGGAVNPAGVVDPNSPDLRKFLPGGKDDPSRGLAGGAHGPDGITGPYTDLWVKVQNRYRVMGSTLLP